MKFYQPLAKICLVTNLDRIHDQDKPAAQALQAKAEKNPRKNNKKERKYINTSEETSVSDESGQSSTARYVVVNYPRRVVINRRFTHMARVTQPITSRTLETLFMFEIVHDASNAFGITRRGGILYVNNSSVLQNSSDKMYQ